MYHLLFPFLFSPSTVSCCSHCEMRCLIVPSLKGVLYICFVCLCVCMHYVYICQMTMPKEGPCSPMIKMFGRTLSFFSVCGGKFGGKCTCTNFLSNLFPTTPPGAIRHGAMCDRYSFKVCYVGQVLTAEGKQ